MRETRDDELDLGLAYLKNPSQQRQKKPVVKRVAPPDSARATSAEQARTGTGDRRRRAAAGRQQAAAGQGRRRRNRRKRVRKRIMLAGISAIIFFCFFFLGKTILSFFSEKAVKTVKITEAEIEELELNHPAWTEDFLTPNEFSRPGDALHEVNNIFVHYTANPGTDARQNRSYFEQLKDTKERAASAHFLIGYEGDIILCIPRNEIAYAVKTRNQDSISIECCYLDEDGSFTEATYESLIELLAWLLQRYELETEDILRHYDCGGKKCPLYYVENEEEWSKLRKDVAAALKKK